MLRVCAASSWKRRIDEERLLVLLTATGRVLWIMRMRA